MRRTTIALALAGVSAISTAAAAQDTGLSPASGQQAPVSDTAPIVKSPTTEGLQEIVVTAQRREESLQRVPVAVSAFNSSTLENLRVANIKNLSALAPSLTIENQGLQSNPSISIRGVASGVSNNAVDPKVGIYLDGVYIGRTTGSVFDLADLERVEVLRGPQGTLFGRNATSGAISLVTAPPTGKFGVRATGSYGNYNAKRGKIVVNLPAFGPFSVKFAYLHDEIDGDIKNLVGGQSVNLSLRDPSFGTQTFANKLGGRNVDAGQAALRGVFGAVTLDYRFDYTDQRTVGRAVQSLGVIPDQSGAILQPIVSLQPFFGGITNISTNGQLRAVANATSLEHVVTQGHSVTLTAKPNDVLTIKSITAFRRFKQSPNIFDLAATGGLRFTFQQLGAFLSGGTPAQIAAALFAPGNVPGPNDQFYSLLTARSTSQRQFSQEVQFQVTTKPFDLTAGVFFFKEHSPATDILGILEPVPAGTVVPSPLDGAFGSGVTKSLSINYSMAEYAQGTLHLGDKIDLTGGLRYTLDDRKYDLFAVSGGQGGRLGVGRYHVSFSKLNYTGIATYRPTNHITAYAKISTGYVAGGILSGIPYNPETLTSYEGGFKTQFYNNRVRLNVAGFHSDYKDLQTQNFINGVQFFDNAGKAKINGAEVEIEAVPIRGLTFSGNAGYSNLEYKTFVLAGVDVAKIARTPYVSKWTARAAAQYDAPDFPNGAHLQGRIEGRYRSDYYLTSTPEVNIVTGQNALEAQNHRPGFWLLDGRVGLVDFPLGGAKMSLSAFGENLTDKRYIDFGAPVLSVVGVYERGRTYGVELGVAF